MSLKYFVHSILLVLCFTSYNSAFILNSETNDSEELINAMVDLTIKHYSTTRRSIIVYGFPPDRYFSELLKLNVSLVVMNHYEKSESTFIIELPDDFTENYIQTPVGMIVFYVERSEMIAEGIVKMMQSIYWDHGVKVICYSKEKVNVGWTFYLFWWYFLIDSIILEIDNNMIFVKEFNPYVHVNLTDKNQFGCWSTMNPEEMYEGNMTPHLQCNVTCAHLDFNRFSKVQYVQSCIKIENNRYDSKSITLRDKTKNLNGHTLSVVFIYIPVVLEFDDSKEGMKKFSGKDGFLWQILSNKLNFTVEYKIRASISEGSLEEYIVSQMDVGFRRCDLSLSPIYLIPFAYPPLDKTYPIEGAGLCFVIHRGELIPTWINFTKMFDPSSLFMVLALFHMMVALYYYYLRKANPTSLIEKIPRSYLYALQLFLSFPVNWTGKNTNLRIFVFLVFWIVFVINFIFQGVVISLLTIPRTEPEINTFEQLYDTGYGIEGYPTPDSKLPAESELFKGINSRFMANTKGVFACTDDLAKRVRKACWQDCSVAKTLSITARDTDGNLYMHIGKDRIHSHYLTYGVSKGSPLKKRLDKYIKNILESGLITKWRGSNTTKITETITNIKTLSMPDLQGIFYFLGFGYIIALIILCVECFIFYITLPVLKCCKDKIKKN